MAAAAESKRCQCNNRGMFCGLATTNGDNPWKGGEQNVTPSVCVVCMCTRMCVSSCAGGLIQRVTRLRMSLMPWEWWGAAGCRSPVGAVHLNNQRAAPSGRIPARVFGPGTLNPAELWECRAPEGPPNSRRWTLKSCTSTFLTRDLAGLEEKDLRGAAAATDGKLDGVQEARTVVATRREVLS